MPIDFQRIEKDGGVTNRAVVSWTRGDGGFSASFDIRYRVGKGDFKEASTTSTSFVIDNVKPGKTLEVKVRAVGAAGFPVKKSRYAKATAIVPNLAQEISGEENKTVTQIVPNVRDLTVTPRGKRTAILEFKPPKNQRLNNLTAIIRHSEKTGGTATFAGTTKLKEVSVTDTSVQVPRLRGTYLIKLRDDVTKKKSDTPVTVELNIPDADPKLEVLNVRENVNIAT
jgi:hypothetical protein|tara:strand:+ start:5902 stop:6579 length:678 start_codon:yes stop_codon:yes gene_type:complete